MAEADFKAEGEGCFRVEGEMTFATVSVLLSASNAIYACSADDVVVDLGQVSRADSAGLALLIEWVRGAQRCAKRIRFRSAPGQIQTLARVSDLDEVLPFSDS